jgi:hypothetical protein
MESQETKPIYDPSKSNFFANIPQSNDTTNDAQNLNTISQQNQSQAFLPIQNQNQINQPQQQTQPLQTNFFPQSQQNVQMPQTQSTSQPQSQSQQSFL